VVVQALAPVHRAAFSSRVIRAMRDLMSLFIVCPFSYWIAIRERTVIEGSPEGCTQSEGPYLFDTELQNGFEGKTRNQNQVHYPTIQSIIFACRPWEYRFPPPIIYTRGQLPFSSRLYFLEAVNDRHAYPIAVLVQLPHIVPEPLDTWRQAATVRINPREWERLDLRLQVV
jgi:hypothetical protein